MLMDLVLQWELWWHNLEKKALIALIVMLVENLIRMEEIFWIQKEKG